MGMVHHARMAVRFAMRNRVVINRMLVPGGYGLCLKALLPWKTRKYMRNE